MSFWLITSASAGASLRVVIRNWEERINNPEKAKAGQKCRTGH
jgi:hypothetical protein